MAPEWMTLPLVVMATVATIIASQACITGAFSVSRQALQLGFIPRMRIDHTSENQEGQIYLPRVNWMLMIGVMSVVVIFQSSSALANAYGIAITLDMIIATILAGFVMHEIWKWKWKYTLTFLTVFLTIDIVFFLSNIIKVPSGGWFPLLVGIIFVFLISTWKKGRKILFKKTKNETMEIDYFFKEMKKIYKSTCRWNGCFLDPKP